MKNVGHVLKRNNHINKATLVFDMVDLQDENRNVLAVGAHPDDVEFLMAGTLALLNKRGYEIHTASICMGDKGSASLGPQEIASTRFREATEAARILGASFETLNVPDCELVFENKIRAKVVECVRKGNPCIVMTMSPSDYLPDHEITANLLWDACFNASVPNYKTGQDDPAKPISKAPYLYYSDSVEGIDRFGKRLVPDFYVDVTSVMKIKEKMLAKHESQRSWLRIQHRIDEYLLTMRKWCQERGKEVNVEFAEVFRQHKGHPFPKKNILQEIIPILTSTKVTGNPIV